MINIIITRKSLTIVSIKPQKQTTKITCLINFFKCFKLNFRNRKLYLFLLLLCRTPVIFKIICNTETISVIKKYHWEEFILASIMDKIQSLIEEADPFSSWWPIIIAVIVGISMTIRTIMGGQRCPSTNLINHQIVIVTGGNSGIGYEISKALSSRSAHVIIGCKDMTKGQNILKILKRELNVRVNVVKEFHIKVKHLDLRSFESIKQFVKEICEEYEHIDILINNAGIIFNQIEKTIDGNEIHLQVNYLGPVLLTHLLLSHLKKSENGRIINVSAHAHVTGKMILDDPLNIGTWATNFHQRDAFAHSKLAVILGSKMLAKELKGTNVTVNVCTPGLVRGTSHLRRSPIMSALCVKLMTFPWMWLFMKTPFEGAQTAIYLATEPSLKNVTGEYFNDCEKAIPSELALDEELGEKLYKETKKILQL